MWWRPIPKWLNLFHMGLPETSSPRFLRKLSDVYMGLEDFYMGQYKPLPQWVCLKIPYIYAILIEKTIE